MNAKKGICTILALCTMVVLSSTILAQPEEVTRQRVGVNWWVVLESLIYAVIGIVLSMLAYKLYDLITPFSLSKELSEQQNIAVGILLGSIFIGIAIIIAASIS